MTDFNCLTTLDNVFLSESVSQSGKPYYKVDIAISSVQPFLQVLEPALGHSKFAQISQCKQQRDGKEFHVTVISPEEKITLTKQDLARPFGLELLGIGMVSSEVYYIVVRADALNSLRKRYGLEASDFHITLGFMDKDIHGVSKGISTLFLSL